MKHSIAKFLSLTLTGLGILVVAGTLDTVKPGTAHAGKADVIVPGKPSSDVVVVNDASQPVPTMAQGTTNVAGTVAVSNMPPVSVANTPATPVYVRDVDNPALQPFATNPSIGVPDGLTGGRGTIATVPSGKTLVIEDINFIVDVPIGQQVRFFGCAVLTSGAASNNDFMPVDTGFNDGTRERFAGGRMVRIYAQAGASISCGFERSSSAGPAFSTFTLNGHYIDTP